MRRLKVGVVAFVTGVLVSVLAPIEAQNVTNAVVIQALNAMGLFGTGYSTGQVPVWNATARQYQPGSPVPAYPLISPSFAGQMTGPTNNTCTAPTYSATGQTGTGMSISTTPSILLGVSGTCRFTLTATELTLTGLLVGPASTAAAPAYAATGALTTGLAITTTPSFILSVAGVAKLTGTATAVTSTVPYLAPDGSEAAPSVAGANFATTGLSWLTVGGGPAVQINTNGTGRMRWDGNTGAQVLRGDWSLAWTSGVVGATIDTFLNRGGAAATVQLGNNAAGVTDQMLKGPDRITSDGLGAAVTVAGGRNRGAFAGGSIIFQTSPAAGAGVTGTLATVLTIDSTKFATFAGGASFVSAVTAPTVQAGTGLNLLSGGGNGLVILNSTGYLALNSTAPAIISTAPTAAGTGMVFAIGTGSTSFDWSITITTANAQSAFTLTLPTATNAWTCKAQNFTTPANDIKMTARSTTTAALSQYNSTTGLVTAYADANVIVGNCTAH